MNLDRNENFLLVKREMPRIAESVRSLWESPEFGEFVGNLLTDSQDGRRRGFPPVVAKALFRLAEDHQEAFPQFYQGQTRLSEVIPAHIRSVYHKPRR